MDMSFRERIVHAWNAFRNKDPTPRHSGHSTFGYRPWIAPMSRGADRSIAGAVFNRIALDVANVSIRHVETDDNGRFKNYVKNSTLDYCFNTEANIDQTGRAFIQDVVLSLFDKGVVAIVPIDTDKNPKITEAFKISTMRVGEIVEYKPDEVKIKVYNDMTGQFEELWYLKRTVALIQNPLYTVMNEYNSVGQRLIRKLSVLDILDDDIASGKWNMLLKMPYSVKQDMRRKRARERVNDLQEQLTNNPYGIAMIDATEQVTQLNRPVDNGLLNQVEFLQKNFYAQLGITEEIMNGTADEDVMTNYYNRSVEPVVAAIVEECRRKFITKTARSEGQSLMYFRNPFSLLSPTKMADVSDKYTRNEILSTNEVRQQIGYIPSDDPRADQLINKNISHSEDVQAPNTENVKGE